MAFLTYLQMDIDENAVKGFSSVVSQDRADTIECLSYQHSALIPRNEATGLPTGVRKMNPLIIEKRFNCPSTPLLWDALCRQKKIGEALFRFFTINEETGLETETTNVKLENARITAIEDVSESAAALGDKTADALQRVSFVFDKMTTTYLDGGVEFVDSWKGEA